MDWAPDFSKTDVRLGAEFLTVKQFTHDDIVRITSAESDAAKVEVGLESNQRLISSGTRKIMWNDFDFQET